MKRYTPVITRAAFTSGFATMIHQEGGDWVRYEDHVEAMKRIAGAPVAQGLTSAQRVALMWASTVADAQGLDLHAAELSAILAQSAPRADHSGGSASAGQAEKTVAAIDSALRGKVNDPDPLPKLHAHSVAGEPTTYGLVAALLRERDALLAKVAKFDQRIVDLGVLAMETAVPAPSASAQQAESVARVAVEQFKSALHRVPYFADRVNKATREKLAEAHSIVLNLPALLDQVQLAAPAPASPAALTDEPVYSNGMTFDQIADAADRNEALEHIEDIEPLLEWCVANVKKWDFPHWDQARKALDKLRALLAASPADQGEDAEYRNEWNEHLQCYERVRVYDVQKMIAAEDARDAKRYRWLRERHWNESTLFVVAGHHSLVRLGTDCPSDDRLDAVIDAAMSASREGV